MYPDHTLCRELNITCPLLNIPTYQKRCCNGACPIQDPQAVTCNEIRRLPLIVKRYVKTCRAVMKK